MGKLSFLHYGKLFLFYSSLQTQLNFLQDFQTEEPASCEFFEKFSHFVGKCNYLHSSLEILLITADSVFLIAEAYTVVLVRFVKPIQPTRSHLFILSFASSFSHVSHTGFTDASVSVSSAICSSLSSEGCVRFSGRQRRQSDSFGQW